jgi:hypothetical protein
MLSRRICRERCLIVFICSDKSLIGLYLRRHRLKISTSHRDAEEAITERLHVTGGFVWTGFDYPGEPTPNQSNYFRELDLPRRRKQLHCVGVRSAVRSWPQKCR